MGQEASQLPTPAARNDPTPPDIEEKVVRKDDVPEFERVFIQFEPGSASLEGSTVLFLEWSRHEALSFKILHGIPHTLTRRRRSQESHTANTLTSILDRGFQLLVLHHPIHSNDVMIASCALLQCLLNNTDKNAVDELSKPIGREQLPHGIFGLQQLGGRALEKTLKNEGIVEGFVYSGWKITMTRLNAVLMKVLFHPATPETTQYSRHWQLFVDPSSAALVEWFDGRDDLGQMIAADKIEGIADIGLRGLIKAAGTAFFLLKEAETFVINPPRQTHDELILWSWYMNNTEDVKEEQETELQALAELRINPLAFDTSTTGRTSYSYIEQSSHQVASRQATTDDSDATQPSGVEDSDNTIMDPSNGRAAGASKKKKKHKGKRNRKKLRSGKQSKAENSGQPSDASPDQEESNSEDDDEADEDKGPLQASQHDAEQTAFSSSILPIVPIPHPTELPTILEEDEEDDQRTPRKATSDTVNQDLTPKQTQPLLPIRLATSTQPALPSAGSEVFYFDNMHPETRCRNPECGKQTHPFDGSTKICPACGERSAVRYCCKTCLYLDVRRHFFDECGSLQIQVPIDESTLNAATKPDRPYIRHASSEMVNTVERHRQSVYSAMENEGEYFIFDDMEQAGSDNPTVEDVQQVRGTGKFVFSVLVPDYASRELFRRALMIALSWGTTNADSTMQCETLGRNIVEDLVARGKWDEQMCTYLCMQMGFEFNYQIPPEQQI